MASDHGIQFTSRIHPCCSGIRVAPHRLTANKSLLGLQKGEPPLKEKSIERLGPRYDWYRSLSDIFLPLRVASNPFIPAMHPLAQGATSPLSLKQQLQRKNLRSNKDIYWKSLLNGWAQIRRYRSLSDNSLPKSVLGRPQGSLGYEQAILNMYPSRLNNDCSEVYWGVIRRSCTHVLNLCL
ncbi:expressed unknown protein [Seminavis robusta]|uniref:Uncharacterized protein n=1 Tax=Seminavis robusta TaxID=568900 RepID=A0A9N8DDS1_9STRA|nr:expressed unknown protein [Seminavis robusta]|eukprot:Sro108_g054071.1  (181) ;mRNA; f:10133-10675